MESWMVSPAICCVRFWITFGGCPSSNGIVVAREVIVSTVAYQCSPAQATQCAWHCKGAVGVERTMMFGDMALQLGVTFSGTPRVFDVDGHLDVVLEKTSRFDVSIAVAECGLGGQPDGVDEVTSITLHNEVVLLP